jgi:hypothetical protein
VELTVDTNVLVKSDAVGDPALRACAVFLLEFRLREDLVLAMDDEGLVEAQYLRHLRAPRFGHQWLTVMLQKKRFRQFHRAALPKKAKRRLLDVCHFDSDDLNLIVRVALSSPSRRIVTEDADFFGATKRELDRHLSITVDSATSIHAELCGKTLGECYERLADSAAKE